MLGGGGFGITYLAQDINLQLPVAIKEYFPGDLAVRSADLSVHVRSGANAASSSGAWSASSKRRGRWPRFATPTSCGCCATSRKTARPTS
jgi:serine/threonine protein kinase